MRIAYSYSRWSSDRQSGGDSYRRQIEASEQYAITHNLQLVNHLLDEGISAYRGRNAADGSALGAFLQALKEGHIRTDSVLIVESLDRISRQSPDKALSLLLSIVTSGIEVVTLFDRRSYKSGDKDLAMQLMAAIMVFGRAYDESQTKSLRQKGAWSHKTKLARDGTAIISRIKPAWIDITDDNKFVLNAQSKIIREIAELYLAGTGVFVISTTLNDKGMKTSSGKWWTQSNVLRIIRSPAIAGIYSSEHNGSTIEGYYPAVVTMDEWAQIISIRTNKTRPVARGRKTTWLSGLMRCGCGSSMITVNGTGFTCRTRYQFGYSECPTIRIPIKELYQSVAHALGHLFTLHESPITEPSNNSAELGKLIEERNSLEDALPLVRDKSRLIDKINTLSDQITQLQRQQDQGLIPFASSQERLRDICTKMMLNKTRDHELEALARTHTLRVIDKIVVDMTTFVRGIETRRIIKITSITGVEMWATVSIPPTGGDNMQRLYRAKRGLNPSIFTIFPEYTTRAAI